MSNHRDECFGKSESKYFWCLHCFRTYLNGEFKIDEDGLQLCPYPDCDGSTVLDAWDWDDYRKPDMLPELPENPIRGMVYEILKMKPVWAKDKDEKKQIAKSKRNSKH